MATILLSAAGAAIGGAVGGGVLGLSSVVIGKAIGATLGRAIDQKLLGGGSEVVETGRMDRMRIMGASEGGAIPRVFGRMRVAGNVIWTSRFKETVTTTQSGGKGAPKGPTTKAFSYSVSLAVALCEGEIARVGRIWADGAIVPKGDLNLRVYAGSEDQLPDPVISAIDGEVPAYRGVAYVVFEDLDLAQFGNRVPQFSFEVVRHVEADGLDDAPSLAEGVQAVALMPGTGEYALATSPVYGPDGRALNLNSAEHVADASSSLDALDGELPNCGAVSLVVSWFGDDLRAGQCSVKPKVEHKKAANSGVGTLPIPIGGQGQGGWVRPLGTAATDRHPWSVAGLSRADAEQVAQVEGRPVYGGTPTDGSVVEAIEALNAQGKDVMFYPFLLMEILEGNTLPDPWSDSGMQAPLPWRGRITTEKAPGVSGSTDATAVAGAEVAAFMGTAQASDFVVSGKTVTYNGPEEWGYRRFILHYAALCKAAGGVSAFCIGSEMRSLTRIRDDLGFPAVAAFRDLAAEVRAILGPDVKLGYAADWSEYFGYHPQDGSGDVYFHLDPLWADDAIDFVGIDNYMPIADWREGDGHLDADAGSIYDLDYLKSGIAGGEGFDWYYRDPQERDLQIRTPISDGAHGEDWIYRYKDLWGWWSNAHHDRVGGVRAAEASPWLPGGKPIWFTELGCAAIDKGPNQPNKFLDPKSSESGIPHYSTGRRDDEVQMQYLRAYFDLFSHESMNPVSGVYGGPMVDMSRAFVWAWDARPWPDFPNNLGYWSDGDNHITGHWLTGRSATQPLSRVVAQLCERTGVHDYDVSELNGIVRGYALSDLETSRASLQPLMVAYGFDAIERGGVLVFRNRDSAVEWDLDDQSVAIDGDAARFEHLRAPSPEVMGDVRLSYVEADGEFAARVAQARLADDAALDSSQNDLALALTDAEARGISERWLSEARIARDTVQFALPPSRGEVQAGDLVRLDEGALFRVDRIEDRGARSVEAVRVERQIYAPSDAVETLPEVRPFTTQTPVAAQFMDLPLLSGDEAAHAPHLAISADPWPGSAAVYSAPQDAGYALNSLIERPAVMGVTQTSLARAAAGLWSRGPVLRVALASGALSSRDEMSVLNGANAAALGDGTSDHWEVFQFSTADLVAPGVYDLSGLLRGQAGSDGIMPDLWPVGSRFVLLDGGPVQIEQDIAARDLARHFRVGPALRPFDDASYRHYVEAFKGNGLRPYSPAHLKARRVGEAFEFSWTRRTRIDGDSWASVDVPLGEDTESYVLRVLQAEQILREETLASAQWNYTAAMRTADGITGSFAVEVAQMSMRFGPGPYSRIELGD